MILGVILAGGLSTRMGGGDKPLKVLGGKPLLNWVIERARPQCDALILNANGDPSRFLPFNLPVIADDLTGFIGPLAGILAGLDYAKSHGFKAIYTFPADTPFFPLDLVQKSGEGLTSVKSGGWRHPIIGQWPVELAKPLRMALEGGERKIDRFTDLHNCRYLEFETIPYDPFFNCNAPEDLEEAIKILPLLKG